MRLEQRFEVMFLPRVEAFSSSVAEVDGEGLPEPHLPLWGQEYESSGLRTMFIGRDTLTWGNMNDFIQCANRTPSASLHRNKGEFDSLAFTDWTNNFGTTFWDTVLKILCGVHGIDDWKKLKRREHEDVLRSFVWANVNSVEKFEVTPAKNEVEWDRWKVFKDASETHIDSFQNLLNCFLPHLVVLMNWAPGESFMDVHLEWESVGDHQIKSFYDDTETHVFRMGHPTWMNRRSLLSPAISNIVQIAKQIGR